MGQTMVATDLGLETLKLGAKSTSFLHKGRLPQALIVTKSCLMLTEEGSRECGVTEVGLRRGQLSKCR